MRVKNIEFHLVSREEFQNQVYFNWFHHEMFMPKIHNFYLSN